MTIILVANQKGGVGKSTIATNLAVVLAQKARDALLLDADRQTSANEWWVERQNLQQDLPKINCLHKYGEIDLPLEDLNSRYEYIVVDVAGRDSDEMRSAMTVADVILMPYKPSAVDLATLHNMSAIIRSASRVNPKLIPYAFISIAPTNSKLREIEQAKDAIQGYPEMRLLKTIIYDRKVYRDAMAEGLGVTELKGKADSELASRREIKELVEEVLSGL